VERDRTAVAGALGGSANEDGAELRARVGALLGAAIIGERSLDSVGLGITGAVGVALSAESDYPVDDLVVHLANAGRVLIQVKRSAGLSRSAQPIQKAVEQFAQAAAAGLRPEDWLVLACARPVRGLLGLGRMLERERTAIPGLPSGVERRAFAQFSDIARQHLDARGVEQLLDRLVIWQTDPTQGDGAAALIAHLEASVCELGHGVDAARELSDIVRTLARLRGGLDAVGLAEVLQARGVPLRSGKAGSPIAAAEALSAYRQRQVRRGSTLALFGASGELANLPLEEADAEIGIELAKHNFGWIGELPLALRRRGRCLLVGHPGGGKSTALRALSAFYARRSNWPVPILIHLKRLEGTRAGITDTILDVACEELAGEQRARLRAALADELSRGRCLLALDGLDEIRRGRFALVAELSQWLSELPDSIEVVLTTRPVTVDEGRRLGFPELLLCRPRNPRATIEAILRAATPVAVGQRAAGWVEVRSGWVLDAIKRDSSLAQTPLTVVILALLAARSQDPSKLPQGRAHILLHALKDVMRTWEIEWRFRGEVALGPLRGSGAREALAVTLRVLAAKTLDKQDIATQEAVTQIAVALTDEFTLRSGDGRAAANDALEFWTDIGLFSFDGDRLSSQVRPLVEVAHAWAAVDMSADEQSHWIEEARASPDLWAALALGAGLSADIAQRWAQGFATDGEVQELRALVDAVRDGAKFQASELAAIVDRCERALMNTGEEIGKVAWLLLDLPLPRRLSARVPSLLRRKVHPRYRNLLEVIGIVRWDERGADADERLRAYLAPRLEEEEPFEHRDYRDYIDAVMSYKDQRVPREILEAVMIRLAGKSREDAEFVCSLEVVESSGVQWLQLLLGPYSDFAKHLKFALKCAGHLDLAEQIELDRHRKDVFSEIDNESIQQPLLMVVASLDEPADLNLVQERRLDELADLVRTTSIAMIQQRWPIEKLKVVSGWIEAVAILGGFDTRVLAGQARLVKSEFEAGERTVRLIYDRGRARRIDQWNQVQHPEAVIASLVDCVGVLEPEQRVEIDAAIALAPNRRYAVELLEARLAQTSLEARRAVACTLLVVDDAAKDRARSWLDASDPMLRSAAAAWWSTQAASGTQIGRELERGLRDPDELVRWHAVSKLRRERLTRAIRRRLSELYYAKRRPWTCAECGRRNLPKEHMMCPGCATGIPDLRRWIDQLFDGRPPRA
jgi:hypothetical protein